MKSRAGPRRALHWEGVTSPNGALTLLARHSPALDACSQLRTLNRGSSAAGKMGFFFLLSPRLSSCWELLPSPCCSQVLSELLRL